MGVQKYKPRSTPRVLEDAVGRLCQRSAMLIEDTRTAVEQTRKLLKESRELLGLDKKNGHQDLLLHIRLTE